MTTQNYLMIQNNVVTNVCIWDGNTNTWTPPVGYTMLVQAETLAGIWELNTTKTDWVLVEVLGVGTLGYTWDGLVLTTDQPKPPTIVQPITSGLKPA